MMQKGADLAWPTFARSAPIIASNALLGHAEVSASLRPLLGEVFLIAVASLLLGIAAYLAFAVLPLRVVDRSFRDLESANTLLRQREEALETQYIRLDAALESMVQGLAMFDSERAYCHRQRPLRRDFRPQPPACEARHFAAGDCRAPHRQGPLCRSGGRRRTEDDARASCARDGLPLRQQTLGRACARRGGSAARGRQLGDNASGCHRAGESCRSAGKAERVAAAARGRTASAEHAFRCGAREYVSGPRNVRCRGAHRHRQ